MIERVQEEMRKRREDSLPEYSLSPRDEINRLSLLFKLDQRLKDAQYELGQEEGSPSWLSMTPKTEKRRGYLEGRIEELRRIIEIINGSL